MKCIIAGHPVHHNVFLNCKEASKAQHSYLPSRRVNSAKSPIHPESSALPRSGQKERNQVLSRYIPTSHQHQRFLSSNKKGGRCFIINQSYNKTGEKVRNTPSSTGIGKSKQKTTTGSHHAKHTVAKLLTQNQQLSHHAPPSRLYWLLQLAVVGHPATAETDRPPHALSMHPCQ